MFEMKKEVRLFLTKTKLHLDDRFDREYELSQLGQTVGISINQMS